MSRRIARLLWVLLLCITGCSPSPEDSHSGNLSPGPATPSLSAGTIGVSLLTYENPFFKVIADHIEAEGAQHGYQVVALSADESPAKQSQQIEDFIVQKVSAIVLSPCETRAVVPAIQAANKAGIPVFTVDIPCREAGVQIACQITTDNKGGGRDAANAMIEAVGSGKIAIIHYQQAESCRLRVEGFRDVIEAYNRTAAAKLEIVAEFEGGGAKDKGRTAAADALQSDPDLRGIFAINDPSALGAVAAVEEAGKARSSPTRSSSPTKWGSKWCAQS
jgi:ribose transport system substrate-binding protein